MWKGKPSIWWETQGSTELLRRIVVQHLMLLTDRGSACLVSCILAIIQPFESIDIRAEQVSDGRREAFRQLIQHPPVALEPLLRELPTTNGFVQLHISFASDSEQRVPGILLKKKD